MNAQGADMLEFNVEKFEASARDNGIRYWLAHEFMEALGYESMASFQSVLNRAMASCAKLNLDPTESFIPETIHDSGKTTKTYRLTRFACFLVSMSADSKKPQVAKAKAVLAALADTLVQQKIDETALGRIETREDLKVAERVMSGVAQDAGLQHSDFGIFKDAGFRGMYNMGLRELKQRKGVDEKRVLYDYMGLEELAGNLFRVTQTSARINKDGVRGLHDLAYTAESVGNEVRQIMLKNSGVPPEALPIAEDITGVKKRLKSAEREMRKLDHRKRIAAPKKAK